MVTFTVDDGMKAVNDELVIRSSSVAEDRLTGYTGFAVVRWVS
jgi:hypothetical protein